MQRGAFFLYAPCNSNLVFVSKLIKVWDGQFWERAQNFLQCPKSVSLNVSSGVPCAVAKVRFGIVHSSLSGLALKILRVGLRLCVYER